MSRYLFFVCFFFFAQAALSQFYYEVTPLKIGNTKGFDLICGKIGEDVIYLSDAVKLKSEVPLIEKGAMALSRADLNETFNSIQSPEPLFPSYGSKSDGAACYNPNDSTLYFSTYNSIIPELQLNTSAIYQVKWNGKGWSKAEILTFCNDGFNYLHPWFDAELGVLVFSSDRKGGHGGADIWFVYKTKEGWTLPANAGGQVNTAGNELFPTTFEGDIFYSSNGLVPERGFELFKAEGRNQWMNAIQLEEPLNSKADDLRIVFLSKDKGMLSSSRSGALGGLDIFIFDRIPRLKSQHNYSAIIEANGNPLPDIGLGVYEESGALLHEFKTNLQGRVSLNSLLLNKKYLVKIKNVTPKLVTSTELKVLDEAGNVLGIFRFNDKGELVLELLEFKYLDLPLAENVDQSVLNISLEGLVLTNSAIKKRIPILIEDMDGNIIASIYSDDTGSFFVDGISPKAEYVFRIGSKFNPDRIVVLNSGKTLVLPFLKEEAYYRRISPENVIELKNEKGESIQISRDDVFIINRIYYETNSARLTEQSFGQLNELLKILRLNDNIDLQLVAHADSRGSQEHNFKLSLLRAKAIQEYLNSKENLNTRIEVQAKGETDLMNLCNDGAICSDQEHAINRRTEIKFVRRSYSQK